MLNATSINVLTYPYVSTTNIEVIGTPCILQNVPDKMFHFF